MRFDLRRRCGRRWPAAALVALASLGAAACGEDGDAGIYIQCGAAPPQRRGVTIVGDSLSVQSEAEYRAAIGDVLVDACNGRTIAGPAASDDGLGRIEPLRASEPGWWVVALGTNDAAYGGDPPEAVRDDARRLLDAIGPEACVAWVLPAVQAPVTPAAIDNITAANQTIVEELGRQECQTLVDWPGAIASEPGLLGPDGVHLTVAGRERLAELVASAVD